MRLATILAAVLPPEDVGASQTYLPQFVGRFVATLPASKRAGLLLLTEIIYWAGPFLFLGRYTTFSRISPLNRERIAERLCNSGQYGIRLAGSMLKYVAGLALVGDPAVGLHIGLKPPEGPLDLPTLDARDLRWSQSDRNGCAGPLQDALERDWTTVTSAV